MKGELIINNIKSTGEIPDADFTFLSIINDFPEFDYSWNSSEYFSINGNITVEAVSKIISVVKESRLGLPSDLNISETAINMTW